MFLILRNELSMWWAVPVMLVISHLMHGAAVGFHEASHGLLRRNRTVQRIRRRADRRCSSFMSFTLYRASHQTHHAHLATERDEELWPFVLTTIAALGTRSGRLLELNFGLFFVPFLFLRTFLRKGSPIRSKKVRKRIWQELALMVVVWTGHVCPPSGISTSGLISSGCSCCPPSSPETSRAGANTSNTSV